MLELMLAASLLIAPQASNSPAPVSLLDRYAAGDIEGVVLTLDAINLSRAWVDEFTHAADAWIDAGTSPRTRRRQIAAALVLELSYVKLTTHWVILEDLLSWGAARLRRDPPSAFEEDWLHASIALGGRARARNWLDTGGHVRRARERFPDNRLFLLAQAISRTFRGRPGIVAFPQPDDRDLLALVDEADVGAEAGLYAAFLALNRRDFEDALRLADTAKKSGRTPRHSYLAHMTSGRALEGMKKPAAAVDEYRNARAALPGAQSAALALVALLAEAPDGAAAFAELDALVHVEDDDPWRLLGYGEFHRAQELLQRVRSGVR